jgi:hypothetical protein
MGCIFSKPAKISPNASKYQTTTYQSSNAKGNDIAKGNANPQAKKIVKMKSFQSKKAQPNKPKVSRKVDHSDSDWAIYLDEFRNPYFFNAITGNSQWTIPLEIATWPEFQNMGYVTAIVTIPSDAMPGTINIFNILIIYH